MSSIYRIIDRMWRSSFYHITVNDMTTIEILFFVFNRPHNFCVVFLLIIEDKK